MPFVPTFRRTSLLTATAALVVFAAAALPRAAQAEALLLIEADSGKVLQADNATYPWYPASLTKLMTAYVTLHEVKAGRIKLDTLLTVSPTAAAQQPSKMGFTPGTRLTVDNALKMMMVKSANDMAVVLAEGVGGSIDGFSALMNETAQQLGMTQSHFVNPNGLPAEGQVVSARDMGILARAIFRNLPEYEFYMHIPAIKFGRRVTQNFNRLIGRYPGADGMKTGFTCPSGYNLVASAKRGDRHLIAVVLGAPSVKVRGERTAHLLEDGFNGWPFWRLGQEVETLPVLPGEPPNLREQICGKKHGGHDKDEDEEVAQATAQPPALAALAITAASAEEALLAAKPATPAVPVRVFIGAAPKSGAQLLAKTPHPMQRPDGLSGPHEALDLGAVQATAFAPASAGHKGLKAPRVPLPFPRPARW